MQAQVWQWEATGVNSLPEPLRPWMQAMTARGRSGEGQTWAGQVVPSGSCQGIWVAGGGGGGACSSAMTGRAWVAWMVCLACVLPVAVRGGEIDVAVVRFPEPKEAADLLAALEGKSLAELTDDDYLVTKDAVLRGGRVLFAQRLEANGAFMTATRLDNASAEVSGSLRSGKLVLAVTLAEGREEGWGNHSQRSYRGKGVLRGKDPVVVSVRMITGRSQSVVKGRAAVKETTECHVLLAQRR